MDIKIKWLQPHPKTGVLYYRRGVPENLRAYIARSTGKLDL